MDIVQASSFSWRLFHPDKSVSSGVCDHSPDLAPSSHAFFISRSSGAEPPCIARHMTEFTGLDIEMTFKDHYHEARVFLLGEGPGP